MTKEEKYTLAKWAIDHALKSGAQNAKVSIYESQKNDIEVRDKKIEKLQHSKQRSLSISLYVDKKYSVHSTNSLNSKNELKRFIKEAIIGTRYLAEDTFRSLPDPNLYFNQKDKIDLKTFDNKFHSVDPQEKINTVLDIEKEILGKDSRIVSVTAGYADGMSSNVMVTSNGFEGDKENTYFHLYASVSVKDGDARPSSGWNENTIYYDKLKKEGISKTALKHAIQKIGQSKIESGKMPMIVENKVAIQCLGPLLSALAGSAIQQKNSFLLNKLDKKIGSDLLTIIDDPLIISGWGSRQFNGEGLALKKRTIFDKGILKSYYIDTYYGKKLKIDPNSLSASNLVMPSGNRSMEEMVADLKKGILITGFNGGNTNGSTGDFSFGIEGFLIENGKMVQPISEMNISGNMIKLWKDLVEVGNDPDMDSPSRLPSLKFDNVEFSGI